MSREMFGKRRIPISAKDLKQAVLKRNKKLESRNNQLDSDAKGKVKELKSLEKEYSSESKRLGNLLKDIAFQEEKFQKIKGGIYSNEKLLSEKLKKVGSAEKELCVYESTVEKLEDRKTKLEKEIKTLDYYKSKCSKSKNELAGIQIKKDNALKDLGKIEDDISKLCVDHNNKVLSYEKEYNALEEKAKKHEDMVCQFEQRLIDTQNLFNKEEGKLRDLLDKSKGEKENAKNELQAIQNLCSNTEDKYIEWEQKIAKAKARADKEKERFKKMNTKIDRYRIEVLEEMARVKLKNKIEKINEAKLSDILNG